MTYCNHIIIWFSYWLYLFVLNNVITILIVDAILCYIMHICWSDANAGYILCSLYLGQWLGWTAIVYINSAFTISNFTDFLFRVSTIFCFSKNLLSVLQQLEHCITNIDFLIVGYIDQESQLFSTDQLSGTLKAYWDAVAQTTTTYCVMMLKCFSLINTGIFIDIVTDSMLQLEDIEVKYLHSLLANDCFQELLMMFDDDDWSWLMMMMMTKNPSNAVWWKHVGSWVFSFLFKLLC